MAQSIFVGFLSVNEYAHRMIHALVAQGVVSAQNIYVHDTDANHRGEYTALGVHQLDSDVSVLMKAEIVVIAANKREFSTVLAPIHALTRGKILLSISDEMDCENIQEMVMRGTLVATAEPHEGDGGCRLNQLCYGEGFPDYMKHACAEIVGSMCH